MPNVIASHSLQAIKKTAATFDFADSDIAPQLICPACKLIVSKCSTCRYLGTETSLKDLEALEIIKANMRKIPDKSDPDKFFVHFDYIFKSDPFKLYNYNLSNSHLAKKSAERLRARLIKDDLLDTFHKEMEKSLQKGHFAIVEGELKKRFDELGIANHINFNYVIKKSSQSQGCRPVSNSAAYHRSGDLNSNLLEAPQSINNALHIVWNFLWHAIGYAADYSRAYRSVITAE